MARWRELAVTAPSFDADSMSEEGYLEKVTAWSGSIQSFRDELIEDLVLDVEGLTLGGKAVSRAEGLAFILDNEGLREEVFLAVIAEGTLTVSEGKD